MNMNNDNRNNQNKKLDKRRIMVNIYQLGFALNEAVDIYSDYFGPLLASNVTSENYWMWVATPMPWELED